MAIQRKNRADLRSYFQTGDRPTQSEFEELIESGLNILEDKATQVDIDAAISSNDKFVTVESAKKVARKSITVNGQTPDTTTGNILLPTTEVPLTFATGLTRTVNAVAVNQTQNISKLSNLTTNGFVKTSGSNGTLIVADITGSDITGSSLPANIVSSSLTSFGATPNIGTATATSLTASGNVMSSGGGIGYATGNGGIVTQLTNKSTAVTLNKQTGDNLVGQSI